MFGLFGLRIMIFELLRKNPICSTHESNQRRVEGNNIEEEIERIRRNEFCWKFLILISGKS